MRWMASVFVIISLSFSADAGEARPSNWRDAYKDSLFAPHAIADFDQARTLMAEEMERLVESCDLTPAGRARLEGKLGDLEYRYIVKRYGLPEEQTERNAQRRGAVRSNAAYDTQYREPAHSSQPAGAGDSGPRPPHT